MKTEQQMLERRARYMARKTLKRGMICRIKIIQHTESIIERLSKFTQEDFYKNNVPITIGCPMTCAHLPGTLKGCPYLFEVAQNDTDKSEMFSSCGCLLIEDNLLTVPKALKGLQLVLRYMKEEATK